MVFVSIPDEVIDLILTLGLTHPVTDMSRRDIYWRSRRPVHRVHNLTTYMCLNLLQPEGPFQACTVIAFPLPGVDSACNRYKQKGYLLAVKAASA